MKLGRTFLHAAELTFRHPGTDREVSFSSELPDELTDFLSSIPDEQ
jgi:23S rRNA-/tRNA-specific pseudouridylate synthase